MKQKLLLLFILSGIISNLVAQTGKKNIFAVNGQKKPDLFGLAFNLSDFATPNNGSGKSISIKDMSQGFSLYYWKGLTPSIDFSARLNGIFHDYSAIYYGLPGKTEIGLELEPNINIRPIKDENIWAPFLSAGLGMGLYTNHIGAYLPLGGGIQFNAASTTYFFLQAQYKVAITKKVLDNNLFYSLGFAQNVSSNPGTAPAKTPAVPSN